MGTGGRSRRAGLAAVAALIAALALACLAPGAASATTIAGTAKSKGQKGHLYKATIRRTRYGVPHILAKSIGDVAYGYGYAFAQDNICTMAESYVTVDGQRSRFFGPNGSWEFRGNGSTNNNLNSDFFYQRINDSGIIDKLVNEAPPKGPKPEIRAGVKGYVAGYNKYLRRKGVDGLPDPRCRGKEWVHPITAEEVYRRFYQLASLASSGVAIDGIGKAAPLTGSASQQRSAEKRLRPNSLRLPIGSNAYGLGGDITDNGRGMVLGNPHFPWLGPERLYQSQLTIPGKYNVEGGSLYGVPIILIGHTKGLAWSHTVATAYRFTPFELTLASGDPTSYVVDGQTKKMQADKVTVQVKQDDGSLKPESRTLYRTEYGPMLTEILGLPLFPWTSSRAYAMGDVNENNFRYLNHFYDTNKAQTTRQLDGIERKYQGIPWVNTMAADSKGEAYYTMDGAIPNVPDSKVADCPSALGQVSFSVLGLPTLDGSKSSCKWDNDPDAAVPGIFGPSHIPRLFRRDYVENSNDSHWLSNANQPLEGFARIIGDERTARSLRTRLGLVQIEDRLAGRDGLPGNKFTLAALQHTVTGDRVMSAELWRDDLVKMCQDNPTLVGSDGPVDVSGACPVLAAWDLRDNLDSRGAVLFQRFAQKALGNPGGLPVGLPAPGTSPFANPFSLNDPVHTPNGLNTSSPSVRQSFADAVTDLRSTGIPLNGTLGSYQWTDRGERIPIHGGIGDPLGVFNAISGHWKPGQGYANVDNGSSFIMAMQFVKGKCPVQARTFVTYSESENPDSKHYNDFTKAFSNKAWSNERFCERDIRRDPALKVFKVRGR